MIKIVNTISAYHNFHVSEAIAELRSNGFIVTQVVRVERMKFIVFGEDVTHIHYIEQ